jgi:hypothetical protein
MPDRGSKKRKKKSKAGGGYYTLVRSRELEENGGRCRIGFSSDPSKIHRRGPRQIKQNRRGEGRREGGGRSKLPNAGGVVSGREGGRKDSAVARGCCVGGGEESRRESRRGDGARDGSDGCPSRDLVKVGVEERRCLGQRQASDRSSALIRW